MGLFDRFKKSNEKTPETIQTQNNDTVSLEKKISLRKDIILDETKRQNIKNTNARVVFALDHSGSMSSQYKNGNVQTLLERIFPMAMCFDDNQELDFYLFDDRDKELAPVTPRNLAGYVQENIINKNIQYGGTNYAPVINTIMTKYAKMNPSNIPTFVIFITDGDNFDEPATTTAITEASKYNIFWKFIGIGYGNYFSFLEKLDNMKGRVVDNANFIPIKNIHNMSDKDLYKKLLEEYADWQKNCQRVNIPV